MFLTQYVILIYLMIKYNSNIKYDKSCQNHIERLILMIKIKLSDLLGKHKMTQKALADITHIRPATISKMYYEETKRVDIKQLNNICQAFNCEISDLIEYIPDEDSK